MSISSWYLNGVVSLVQLRSRGGGGESVIDSLLYVVPSYATLQFIWLQVFFLVCEKEFMIQRLTLLQEGAGYFVLIGVIGLAQWLYLRYWVGIEKISSLAGSSECGPVPKRAYVLLGAMASGVPALLFLSLIYSA